MFCYFAISCGVSDGCFFFAELSLLEKDIFKKVGGKESKSVKILVECGVKNGKYIYSKVKKIKINK